MLGTWQKRQLAMTDLSEFRARRTVAPEPAPLPTDTVTFLLTDIESSTRTWESHGPANNLPVHLTSFVGREPALAELGTLLGDHRLVSLVGAGGSGKTRLAAQVAADVSERHPDGVWWVDLAAVGDPAKVAWTVMAALGMGDDRGLDPVGRITGCLGDSRTLVVLDNCEHLLDAVAGLADGLLRSCPNLTVLATSREPLGISGELSWRVPPLSLPGDGDFSVDDVLRSEGVRLFVDRARDARPSFDVDADNAPVLAAICTRLDGLPLAIELAAARVRSLPPQRILDGLSDRFRLLTGGARTATARQKTLHASVEWSHDLLSEEERILLRRLAAFAGGFTLDAAEAVAAAPPLEHWEVLGLLSSLVDRSLVVFDGERYRLLQTIHDFATARLLSSGETDAVRDRHAAWFLDLAESASAELERALRPTALAALAVEHDNLRVAMEWSIVKEDDELALRLIVALGFFWIVHGHYTEGLAWHRPARCGKRPAASAGRWTKPRTTPMSPGSGSRWATRTSIGASGRVRRCRSPRRRRTPPGPEVSASGPAPGGTRSPRRNSASSVWPPRA
jgi:predicted ATPase